MCRIQTITKPVSRKLMALLVSEHCPSRKELQGPDWTIRSIAWQDRFSRVTVVEEQEATEVEAQRDLTS